VQLLESPDLLIVETSEGVPAPRRLRLGDVAILLRSLGDAQVYEEALREHGLDYYLAGGHAFYSQQEIYDILNLLRAVASTVDEIALAGALRSPLFALADETLMWLVERHKSLNAALAAQDLPTHLAPVEADKVRRAAATLDRLRREKDRLLVAELLTLALELTGYDATLLCEFLGPRKAANVEKLVEQARALDRSSPGDLPGFITQLSEFVLRAPKEALAATQTEGDVIRIMTIHYAKGLEFPLVVLPDLERKRHAGGFEPVLDKELGPLVPLADRDGAVGLDLRRHIENIADLEERKRLLYVACTRASDYLILSSSIDDLERPKSDWLQLVNARISLADGALRGALPPDFCAPAVRVITKPPPRGGAARIGGPRHADLRLLVRKTRDLAATTRGGLPPEAGALPVDAAARRRFSFSQITGTLSIAASNDDVSRDAESAERSATDAAAEPISHDSGGANFGALVHAALERVDFRQPRHVRGLCDWLAPQYVGANPERSAMEAAKLIERFLKSPRAAALATAPLVRREIEFLLPWPPETSRDATHRRRTATSVNASPAMRSIAAKHQVEPRFRGSRYLHGYLDCLYQDAHGRWRLLDYKTNRARPGGVSLVEPYQLQMLAYRLACEQALGEPLTECVLVLLDADREHVFAWDAANERRGVEQITAAMDVLAAVLRPPYEAD
jgi:ATP-dependent helicase/nuclease subunit A